MGEGLQLVETIGPVCSAAKQPHNNQLGVGGGLFEIEIGREVVLELQKIGKAKRQGVSIMGAGNGGNLAVGGAEENDVGRRLIEVNGLGSAIDEARCVSEKVHQPRSIAAMAGWSMCFSPMTTSWVWRASPGFHGRSK